MGILINTLAILALLSGCGGNKVDDSSTDAKFGSSPVEFSVLSYNAYLLKTGLKNTLVDERAKVIPDAVAQVGADVIVLQEIWERGHMDHFVSRLKSHGYSYSAFVDSRDETAELGNGKMIFSRYPMYAQDVSFSPWPTKTSWTEKMANKGLLSAAVNINGRFVRIFNAHTSTKRLDSETGIYDKGHIEARKAQFDQIIDAINVDDSDGQILAADLNMHPFALNESGKSYSDSQLDSEYAYVQQFSQMSNSFSDDEMRTLNTFDPKNNKWAAEGIIVDDALSQLIDYQMYKGSLTKRSVSIVMQNNHQIPRKSKITTAPLSDHYGILARYEIK